MNASTFLKELPQDHPANLSNDYSKRNFIFCDDSDDRFERHYHDTSKLPEGLSKADYITWASILIHVDDLQSVLSDLEYIKSRWSVPKIHCSHDEGKRFRDLFYNNNLFRKNFFDFVESLKGHYYFSSILNSKQNLNQILPNVLENFERLDEKDLRDPKFVSLYWHLIKLDRFLPESENEYFAYSDRISSVDKKIDVVAAWYGKSHYHLQKINGLICFKTNTSEKFKMSMLLELADFISFSVRRSFQNTRSQDARVLKLSDKEIYSRIAAINSHGEKELVRFSLEMVRTNRYRLLDAIICGSCSDGTQIKL
jgi:hypothetical protein